MLNQRVKVAAILLPFGITAIALGGIPFFILTALILLLAANEYINLFEAGDYEPAKNLILASVFILLFKATILPYGVSLVPYPIDLR